MVVLFEKGALGNQLFQYAAARAYKPTQKILLVGMRQLREAFVCAELLNNSQTGQLLEVFLRNVSYRKIHSMARNWRIFSLVSEHYENGGSVARETTGRIPRFTVFEESYFQSPAIATAKSAPKLRPLHQADAEKFLLTRKLQREHLYFLHHRRGDYLTWPSAEHPALIPQLWYEQQVLHVRANDPKAEFVVVGDDRQYMLEHYSERPGFTVSYESPAVDLGIMSLCGGGGILSASSFSWWGAFLSYLNAESGLFIGPQHWIGHPVGEWYPPAIETKWITYTPVSP